ncbi:MAG TPA: hypothetical protein VHM20_02965 [Gammaproteobacteria bacterium]|jgi:hypothetical protein|nr:hypothetical protein [Gammaproteobacteria bacterium]
MPSKLKRKTLKKRKTAEPVGINQKSGQPKKNSGYNEDYPRVTPRQKK